MEKKEYLNEEEYKRNSAKLKKVGKILLIVGVITLIISFILIVLGLAGFGNLFVDGIRSAEANNIDNYRMARGTFGSVGIVAIGGFINTFGFALTVAGAFILFFAHRREITVFTTQQVMPVAQEGIEKVAPTIGKAAGEIAKGIKKGLKDEDTK